MLYVNDHSPVITGTRINLEPSLILAEAKRLSAGGSHTLAALYIYRAADLAISRFIDKNNPFESWETDPYVTIGSSFIALKRSLIGSTSSLLPVRLGFSDKMICVHLIYPGLLTFCHLEKCLAAAGVRHKSWLAHGDYDITGDEIDLMTSVFEPLIQRLGD